MPVFTAITFPHANILSVFCQIVAALECGACWLRWQLDWLLCASLTHESLTASTDEQLMIRYIDGCSDSFRELFDRYAPRLLRAARRKGLSDSECQDAVQQTFVHVHQGRFEFDLSARVAPWIFTIGFNVMRDYGRRVSAHQRLKTAFNAEAQVTTSAANTSPMTDSDASFVVENDAVRNAISALSEEQREVIWLHYYEEMSFAEIARVLGCKPGAVRGRAHRGYEKLRELLQRSPKEVTV